MKYDTVSFLTDFGIVDESVGIVKSVIRSIAPHASVIDLTHNIPPFDIRTGSVVLARSAEHLMPGVLLAIVDPGVGTDRKAIAVEVGGGESVVVGPDNGLLAPVVAVAGGATRVVELTNPSYQLIGAGKNFAGRDVFGPVVAHLCNGVDLSEFGPIIDAHELVPGTLPFSEEKDGALHGDVIYTDHYGNLHTNIAPEQLESLATDAFCVVINNESHNIKFGAAYGAVSTGEALVLIDEAGMLSLALNQASAADYFKADTGSAVVIQPSPS